MSVTKDGTTADRIIQLTDIGGGYAKHDLSNLSLVWLCSHLDELSLDLDYIVSLSTKPSSSWGALTPHQ